MATPVRLQRYLAAAGVAARRKAEELITAGRVTVNGEVVTKLGTKVDPDRDQVTVDGEAVVPLDYFYVLFNKPKGCITAVSDDRGRLTVMDYLPNLPVPVKPVGRLDFYTEGVLLLTNDGELAARLLAPASHVPKTYHVKVHGQVRPEHVKRLRNGVQLDDGTTTLPAEVEVLPGESKHTWLAITIHEGKHRQIHRMIEALGYRVDKLQRVAFANLTFHHLRVGDARELTQQELNELRDLVGLDHSAVARGKWKSKREETDIPRRARAKALAEAEETAARAAAPRQPGADDREEWGWAGEGGQEPAAPPARHAAAEREGAREASRGSQAPERGARDGERRGGREAARGGGGGFGERRGGREAARGGGGGFGERRGGGRGPGLGGRADNLAGQRGRGAGPRGESAGKRGGQGRTFGKRGGPPSGGRRGPRH
jgi:pseudouridine synthase